MMINGISGTQALQLRSSSSNLENVSSLYTENNNSQVSPLELKSPEQIFSQVDTNSDSIIDQEELFAALTKKLETRSETSIQISIDINVIKAHIGSLLSSEFNRFDSEFINGLSNLANSSGEQSRSDINTRERYISALITADIDNGGFFGNSGTFSSNGGSTSPLSFFSLNQGDGRELLFNLLVDDLETPEQDALTIIQLLQNISFQTYA